LIKIKILCKNNILFKRNFNGFNYTIFDKKELFVKNNIGLFYNYVNNINIPIYEVLSYNTNTKIYMDCEMEDLPKNICSQKEKIILEFNNNLLNYLYKLFPNNNIKLLYSDASRLKSENIYKLSLHVIVNNLGYFENRKKLKCLISNFSKQLNKEIFYRNGKCFVDHEVYHISQLIRIPFSSNKNPDSLLKPFVIENNNIIYKDKNYISNNYANNLCGFYDYECKNKLDDIIEVDNYENKKISNVIPKNNNVEISTNNHVGIPIWKINWIKNNINGNKVNLKRMISAHCSLCERTHDSDNAFCIIYQNNIILYCNRNSKGISIGSWYNNKNNNINSLDNKLINNLREENINLKEKIKYLEEKIKSITILNNKEIHICTTNKNKKDNLFLKYYEAGLELVNNNEESFNKYIQNKFNIKNISLLKNRCLRIYNLLEYAKKNNFTHIKSSLRSIFHVPNWKFTELMKSNEFTMCN
jgi:hypothetical protein